MAHPCCVIVGVTRPGTDRQTRGVQLCLRDVPRVRVPASCSMQTESVPVGSAISLFSGAGGLDLGVETAGFCGSLELSLRRLPWQRSQSHAPKRHANPMTCQTDSGWQFVVIATGHGTDAALAAFAPPEQ